MSKTIKNYSMIEVVGEGMFGKVYRAVNIQNEREYAVKIMELWKLQKFPKLLEYAQKEVKIMENIKQHPHIIRFFETFQTTQKLYLVYEFCNGGTLQKILDKQKTLSEERALIILQQLLEAFKILNQNNIMHRDLKPDNIFFHNGILKLGDFGFCKDLSDQDKGMTKTMVGSPIYMAPQVLQGQKYSNKADIWSLGVILYQMIYGRYPFASSTIPNLLKMYQHTDLVFPGQIKPKTKAFIRRMLTKDHRKRISWIEIFSIHINQNGVIENDGFSTQRIFHKAESLHLLALTPNISNKNIDRKQHQLFKKKPLRTSRSKSIKILPNRRSSEKQVLKTQKKHQQIQRQCQLDSGKEKNIFVEKVIHNQIHNSHQLPKSPKKLPFNSSKHTSLNLQNKSIQLSDKNYRIDLQHQPAKKMVLADERVKIVKQHKELVQGVHLALKVSGLNMKCRLDFIYIILNSCCKRFGGHVTNLRKKNEDPERTTANQSTFLRIYENSLHLLETEKASIRSEIEQMQRSQGKSQWQIKQKVDILSTISFEF